MKLHEVINAQEANENAFRNCVIDAAAFKAEEARLAKLYTTAMVAAQRAIAKAGGAS